MLFYFFYFFKLIRQKMQFSAIRNCSFAFPPKKYTVFWRKIVFFLNYFPGKILFRIESSELKRLKIVRSSFYFFFFFIHIYFIFRYFTVILFYWNILLLDLIRDLIRTHLYWLDIFLICYVYHVNLIIQVHLKIIPHISR